MKIDRLIDELTKIKNQHGNVECGYYKDEYDSHSLLMSVDVVSEPDRSSGWGDDKELGDLFVALS